jgi:maleate isomerase
MRPSRGRARIGVLVPFTNTNLEPDLALMAPPGLSLHIARMGGYDEDEVPDETQMQGLGAMDLDETLALLSGAKPDVVLYGCTSATLTHGPGFDRDLAARIHARSGAATVTAAGALVHALATLGATRIAFASPYVPAINDMAIAFLAEMGIETVARADMDGALSNEGKGALTPRGCHRARAARRSPRRAGPRPVLHRHAGRRMCRGRGGAARQARGHIEPGDAVSRPCRPSASRSPSGFRPACWRCPAP